MATGKQSDFVIFEDQYYGGQYEVFAQEVNAFNAASGNTIQLVTKALIGNYQQESFLKKIAGLISRRDATSVSTATDLAMTQDQFVSCKVNRKIGPIGQTLDAWRKIGKDAREMSAKIGMMIAKDKLGDYLNTALLAVEAAIEGQSTALTYDATGQSTKTLTHGWLVNAMAKMGDRGQAIKCWVMHSKPYYDLMAQSISDKIYGVADLVIHQGTPATLGRPVIVTDAAALTDANGSATDTYNVLGLVEGGVVVTESEIEEIQAQVITGLENLIYRIQGEYAFNIACKGFKYDYSDGGANPTDADIATTEHWDQAATDDKDLAGVRVIVN